MGVAARKGKTQTGTAALAALVAAGVPHAVHPYEHDATSSTSYGSEAAAALGLSPDRVFKTLVADVDGALVVAVVPVSGSLDLKALARVVGGKKAAMAAQPAAERSTGYVVGGISPIGQRQRLRTVVDATASDHETVFVSAGKRGVDVELAPSDLVAMTAATVGDDRRVASVSQAADPEGLAGRAPLERHSGCRVATRPAEILWRAPLVPDRRTGAK